MSKKQVYILKTGVYDPCLNGLNKYSSYEYVTRQKYSPPVMKKESLGKLKEYLTEGVVDKVSKIYCSQATRTFETAGLILRYFTRGKMEVISIDELNEVKFSLKQLLTKEEYEQFGSDLVRERFIEYFIEDRLLESRKQLKKRVEKLLKRLNYSQENAYLLISHSFFMKLLQVYLQDNSLFEHPKVLKNYFDPLQRTFDCGAGFSFNLE